MADAALAEAIKALPLKSKDDEDMAYVSHRMLESERLQVMAAAFPEVQDASQVVAIIAKGPGDEKRELIAVGGGEGSELKLVTGNCQITYEDLSPSECIEYLFSEAPGRWAMAQLSLGALETYRSMKFESWRHMLVQPTCEAQFRRMLHIGMVSQLFDGHVFSTPDDLKSKYQVTDERTGKLIDLPHPVGELRVWNPATLQYDSKDPHLQGAPPEAERDAWWENFVKQLKEEHGDEYIEKLLAGK